MSIKRVKYKAIFDDEKLNLSPLEKDSLFENILTTKRHKRTRKFAVYSVGAALIIFASIFSTFHSFRNEDELDIVAISNQHKQLVYGKETAVLLQADSLGYSASIDKYQSGLVETDSVILFGKSNLDGYTTIYIPFGQRKEVILPDGTKVWLNAGSLLTFYNNINDRDRLVYLDGEGYFDVIKNNRKFIIHTPKSTITVLGTSFNLSCYQSDGFQSLDLITGKVLFESNSRDISPLEITAGQRIHFSYSDNHILLNKSSNGDDMLWTKKQLKLDRSTLPILFKRLEKIYNIDIIYNDILQNNEPYSGRLNLDADIVTVLRSIYELNNYKIILKERKVYIEK